MTRIPINTVNGSTLVVLITLLPSSSLAAGLAWFIGAVILRIS